MLRIELRGCRPKRQIAKTDKMEDGNGVAFHDSFTARTQSGQLSDVHWFKRLFYFPMARTYPAVKNGVVQNCRSLSKLGLPIVMRTNYVLVDFENVQPKDLGLLKDGPFKVKLFLGPNQSKIPVALASALQSLGSSAEYVILETAGNNALDFHIAYYIGVLSSEDPAAFFHVISKDNGFDPLIKYLKGKKVFAQRSTCIADIPYFKPSLPAAPVEQIEIVVADLQRRKASKPRTQKTLLSTLHALFKKGLSEQQLESLFQSLCTKGIVKLDGAKVSYDLPSEP